MDTAHRLEAGRFDLCCVALARGVLGRDREGAKSCLKQRGVLGTIIEVSSISASRTAFSKETGGDGINRTP